MFFIVPERKASNLPCSPPSENHPSSPPPAKRQRLSPEADEKASGYYPKRTPKACDRCRMKKARCQWHREKICDKCKRDGVICTTLRESKREPKPPNAAYVQLVESQRDCLLQAISTIMEGGLSTSQTAMAKILQEYGIRAGDAGKASRQKSRSDLLAEFDGQDLFQNDAEIQALLNYCDPKLEADAAVEQPSTIPPGTDTQSNSYFDFSFRDGLKPNCALPESSAGALLSPALFSPSIDIGDWLVPDDDGDNWLPLSFDLAIG